MQPVENSVVSAAPPGPAFVYMPVPVRTNTYDRYKHKHSIGLGITQMIIGILCMIFNSVCLGIVQYIPEAGLGVVGHGYWCGAMFLITGIFGITAGKKKTRCHIVTYMVLCIISAVITIALLVVGILGAVTTDRTKCYDRYYGYGYYYDSYPNYRTVCDTVPSSEAIIAMESCLAIFGFIEAILAIWGSALCCSSGVCCCSRPATAMPAVGYFSQAGQIISISQTQGGPYVYAPQPTFSYPQVGLMPSSAYVQTGWTMPTNNIGPVIGQAPPPYVINPAQPLWMVPPATTNPDPVAAQAPPTDQVPNHVKEFKGPGKESCAC